MTSSPPKKAFVEKNCLNCKLAFRVRNSQNIERIRYGKIYKCGKYCSKKCFREFFKKNFRPTLNKTWKHTEEYKRKLSINRMGKNNPQYVHGAYSGKARRGKQKPQKDFRTAVFKRDNYTCYICKQRGGNKEAHHICPWGLFPKLRYEISNGITLCKPCHRKIHSSIRKERTETVKADVWFYLGHLERLTKIYERN